MNDVEEIKSRVDIVQLIGESVQLKKAGRNFKGLCPFHSEKTPSFMVSPDRGTYHCFGCGEGGDIFEFVMKREAVDFSEALKMLAARAGVQLSIRNPEAHQAKQRLFSLNEQAVKYFQAALKHSAGRVAGDYLRQRGISEATASQFQIGYAPDDYEAMVKALKSKKFTDKELLDAGLAGKGSRGLYARFRHRLMIPIADSSGVVRGFTGRILVEDGTSKGAANGAQQAKYVNTPDTDLYHKGKLVYALHLAKQPIISGEAAVLVEGQMDVISAHQAGTPNVVATSGTAMTEDQLRQLTRFTKTIIIAFDNDAAGRQAMQRVIELVGDRDIELKTVDLGQAKDPDELINGDPKLWKERVKTAEPVIDYLIAKALPASGRATPYSRSDITAALDEVLPALSYRSALDQDYYSEQLAAALGVEKDSVKDRLAKVAKVVKADHTTTTTEAAGSAEAKTPEEMVSERMLGLIVITSELAPKLEPIDERIFPESYQSAAKSLKSKYNKQTVNDADRSLLAVSSLAAAEYEPMTTEERAAEFDRLYTRLKLLWVKQHQPKLLAAIRRAEQGGDRERRNRLMEEYTTLTKRTTHG